MNNSKKCISIYKKYIKYKSYTMEYNIYIYKCMQNMYTPGTTHSTTRLPK